MAVNHFQSRAIFLSFLFAHLLVCLTYSLSFSPPHYDTILHIAVIVIFLCFGFNLFSFSFFKVTSNFIILERPLSLKLMFSPLISIYIIFSQTQILIDSRYRSYTMSNLHTIWCFLFCYSLFFVAGLFLFFSLFSSFQPACCSFSFVPFFLFFLFFFIGLFLFFFFHWDFSKFPLARLLSAIFFLSLAASWIVYPGSKPCHERHAWLKAPNRIMLYTHMQMHACRIIKTTQ